MAADPPGPIAPSAAPCAEGAARRWGGTSIALATAVLAAAADTLACPPYGWAALAWVVPALLVVPCRGRDARHAVLAAVVFALAIGVGITGWAFHASLEYFDFHRATAGGFVVAVWLLYGGVPFALMLVAYARFADRLPAAARAPFAAWTWAVMEVLRRTLCTGMPWELLGDTQYRFLTLAQVADLGGVSAVSFVMVLASVAVGEALRDARGLPRARLELRRRLAPALALLVVVLAYGSLAERQYDTTPSRRAFRVAIIQGDVPNAYRWQREHMERTLGTYVGLTASTRASRPDLVVWPENAVDVYLEHEPLLQMQLARAAAFAPGGLLFGSPRLAAAGEARNSAQLIATDGRIVARYDKQHLVPFAEVSLFPDRTAAAADDPVYGPGPRAEPLASPVGRLGTMICYEVLFPRLVNDLVRRGADVLVNLANDSWLDAGNGAALEQHFSMAVFRAIETRRDLVRVAGSGASGVIDAAGRIGATVRRNTAGAIVARAALRTGLTPYVRWGDAWILAFAAPTLFELARRRRGNPGTTPTS